MVTSTCTYTIPSSFTIQTVPVYLRPSKRSRSVIILLPLLPPPPAASKELGLPPETWLRCIQYAMAFDDEDVYNPYRVLHERASKSYRPWRKDLVTVCRSFKVRSFTWNSRSTLFKICNVGRKDLATPVLYSRIHLRSPSSLRALHETIHLADQKWDSLRRIPFSSPGRWIQHLNLVALNLAFTSPLQIDTILSHLFTLTPFLRKLDLNPDIILSRRALTALGENCGSGLTGLKGLGTCGGWSLQQSGNQVDSLLVLLSMCTSLEELSIFGPGLLDDSVELPSVSPSSLLPLSFPRLHALAISGIPHSPLFVQLLQTPLPSLTSLAMTPYHPPYTPSSPTSHFLSKHGTNLKSLVFLSLPDWPVPDVEAPPSVLHTSPSLEHLHFSLPLPSILLTPPSSHPLRTISIPRPTPEILSCLENLQHLEWVEVRNVRWLRGLTIGAIHAGFQGELNTWRRKLRGVRIVDADGRE
jgi:hypothetical protein